MGDMGDFYNAMREDGQQRRARNRESSRGILEEFGIDFEERNDGAHLIVTHDGKRVDFWPGTGLWITKSGRKRRGVWPLLRWLGFVSEKKGGE